MSIRAGIKHHTQETDISPGEFYAINSIYELQSVINKLNIEKEKAQIAFVSLAEDLKKENCELCQKNLSALGELQRFEVIVQVLKKEILSLKSSNSNLMKQKKDLEGFLEIVPKFEGQMSANLLVIEYTRNKKELKDKDQSISNLKMQLRTKERQLFEVSTQNSTFKELIQKQKSSMSQHLEEQKTFFYNEKRKLKETAQMNQRKFHEEMSLMKKMLNTYQGQNQDLLKQLTNYKRSLFNLQKQKIDTIIQIPQVSPFSLNSHHQYQQLLQKLNLQIQQKGHLLAQLQLKSKQVDHFNVVVQGYVQQIELLESRLQQKHSIEFKIRNVVDFGESETPKKETKDLLTKYQEICFDFQKERKNFQKKSERYGKRIKELELQNDTLKEEKLSLKQKIETQIMLVQSLSQKNKDLQSNLNIEQTKMSQIREEKEKLRNQIQKFNIDKKRENFRCSSYEKNLEGTQKYHVLIKEFNNLEREKAVLIKENLELKSDLKSSQSQTLKRIKLNQQMVEDCWRKQRKIEKSVIELQEEKLSLIEKIKKLEYARVEKESFENSQRDELFSKVLMLNTCLQNLRKEKQKLEIKRTNRMSFRSKTVEATLFPFPSKSPQQTSISTKKPLVLQKIPQENQFNIGNLQIIKNRWERSKTDRVVYSKANRIGTDFNDDSLNNKINQLKRQNRELSIHKLK